MNKSTDQYFLEFVNVSKSFDGLKVFENLSLYLKPGTIYGLVGPNACGKTTLLHAAIGLNSLDRGTIRYYGHNISGLKTHSIARLGLGLVLQNIGLFNRISVMDNVLMGQAARKHWMQTSNRLDTNGQSKKERAHWALEEVGLLEKINNTAGSLVPGEQKCLAIARALFAACDFLFDEPVSGIDIETRQSFPHLFRKLAEEGRSILIVEHDLGFVLETCDEVIMLKDGNIVCQGQPNEVKLNDTFNSFYSSLQV